MAWPPAPQSCRSPATRAGRAVAGADPGLLEGAASGPGAWSQFALAVCVNDPHVVVTVATNCTVPPAVTVVDPGLTSSDKILYRTVRAAVWLFVGSARLVATT
jgi:hypothetical protein